MAATRGARKGVRLRQSVVLAAVALAVPLTAAPAPAPAQDTASPVKHLVVVFDENVSFDHYFATYPQAANTDGTRFTGPRASAVRIDNLRTAGLLRRNPNQYAPRRLGPQQAMTCDQNHSYSPEQYAADGGRMDGFVQHTGAGTCSGHLYGEPGLVMDYYDGNTVTALWNYARLYALNDRFFATTYGPSTPGALNLVSGQTHGAVSVDPASGTEHPRPLRRPAASVVASPDAHGVGTVVTDPEPAYDDCSDADHTAKDPLAALGGRTIGDRLNDKGVSWGWFQGGFRPSTPWDGRRGHYARCSGTAHTNVGGARVIDYSPHHEPFQYYASTANPHHLPPRSVAEIGHRGPANHQYDLSDFDAALRAGRLPAVSFLKPPAFQDGHAGYSDPLDEQRFLVEWINRIQSAPQWRDTAVVIAYDDSDGWYDHVWAPPLNGSRDSRRAAGGAPVDAPACRSGPAPAGGYADRCGPGPRLPLLVVSPYARAGTVDHTRTEQTSVLKFIEWNWRTARIGDASFDARAGSLLGMFDFAHPDRRRVLLGADGSVKSVGPITRVAPARTRIAVGASGPRSAVPAASSAGEGGPGGRALVTAGVLAAAGAGAVVVLRRRAARGREGG
ncbi:phospholipase C [Streptomyces gamaensis]|uniref:Phospholipase C n=1 Tax=Streptomyces gamaensis TaxID=1763542 RepID=A0ABW0Z8F5_9ACTN